MAGTTFGEECGNAKTANVFALPFLEEDYDNGKLNDDILGAKEKIMTITEEMVRHAYTVALQVYEQELTVTAGKELLANNHHWDFGSAGDYIHNFGHLLRGEQYTRTMNSFATQYFLEQIFIDYGQEALRIALNAVEAHIEYYAAYRNLNASVRSMTGLWV